MHISWACPLSVASILWQPRPDAHALTVVCKATFTLRPGESRLSDEQQAVWSMDQLWEDGRGSMRGAGDLVPFKRRVDVIVMGHAHAPQRKPVTSLVARITIGGVDKAVEVHGDRFWTPDGQLTAPVPFTRMPLCWERAAGGPGTWNPVGLPANIEAGADGRRPAPNLVPVGTAVRSPGEVIAPAGLGPLAPTWPERVAKLRRHATTWEHEGWSEQPLPGDIDAAYFNVAPPDQQLEALHGNEWMVLENLHPDHPQLMTLLEDVIPRAELQRSGEAPQEVRLRRDTLVIDADLGICTLTWRGVVPLRHAEDDGVVLITADRLPRDEDPGERTSELISGQAASSRPALPFVAHADHAPSFAIVDVGAQGSVPPPSSVAPAQRASAQAPLSRDDDDDTVQRAPAKASHGTGTLAAPLAPAGAMPLPFRPTRAEEAAPPAPARAADAALLRPARAVDAAPPAPALPLVIEPPRALSYRSTPPPPPSLGAPSPPPREADEPAPAPAPDPQVRPEDLTVERFAEITAELAEGRASRAEVLRGHGLEDHDWAAAEQRWLGAIEKDGARGGRLRAAYDGAYVAAVERRRGPISAQEYARIAVGLERGQVNEALDALGIHRAALMPIVRTWVKKLVKDPKLASQATAEVTRLRAE